MSGRAGRRGLDDRGIVVLMVDEKLEPEVARGMLMGQVLLPHTVCVYPLTLPGNVSASHCAVAN